MPAAKITKMADHHRKAIRAFGGDPDHPEVLAEYLKVANCWLRAKGTTTLHDDRLMSLALIHQRPDADKARAVPNGGAGLSPAEKLAAAKQPEGAL